jgi:hypothetical protein
MYFILSNLLSGTYIQFRIQKILYFAIKSVNYISKHAKISVQSQPSVIAYSFTSNK